MNDNIKKLTTPLTKDKIKNLKVGDTVKISGVIYTARDAAHKRMMEAIENNKDLPFDLKDQVIYFVGPTPAPEGRIVGSAGPTTSGRMDKYTPTMIENGISAVIGKGIVSEEVINKMNECKSVYFGAIGGTGALLGSCIKELEVIAYEDLGTEAIRRIVVEDLPVVVIVDTNCNNLYEQGRKKYKIQ